MIRGRDLGDILVSPIVQKRGDSVQSAGCAMRAVMWMGRAPG